MEIFHIAPILGLIRLVLSRSGRYAGSLGSNVVMDAWLRYSREDVYVPSADSTPV